MEGTHGQKALLFIGKYDPYNCANEYTVPFELTMDGIAIALHISRAHSSIVLKKLREKDMVGWRLAHLPGSPKRRYVFFITQKGMRARLELLDEMKKEGITLADVFPPELPMICDSKPDLINAQRMLVDATAELGLEMDSRYPNLSKVMELTTDALKLMSMWLASEVNSKDMARHHRITIESKP